MSPQEKFQRFVTQYPHSRGPFYARPHFTRRQLFRIFGAGVTASCMIGQPAPAGVIVTTGAQVPDGALHTRNVDCVRVQMLHLVCDVLHSSVNVPPAQVREPPSPGRHFRVTAYFDVLSARILFAASWWAAWSASVLLTWTSGVTPAPSQFVFVVRLIDRAKGTPTLKWASTAWNIVGWAPPPVVSPITVTRWMACRL
jgi:hypothetical protein